MQDLLDESQQTIAVLVHDAIELLPLLGIQVAPLERFQVQPDRRQRRLELVGDRVDERIVLLVAPDLAHEKDGVEHEPADDYEEEDDAENQQQPLAPVEEDPPDIERYREGDETAAEDDEGGDLLAARCRHEKRIVQATGCRLQAAGTVWLAKAQATGPIRLQAAGWRLQP